MKALKILAFIVLAVGFSISQAQVYPLSENSWNNPEFVKRFLGSYGVNTRLEPEISREEAELFTELTNVIDSDPAGAINRLRTATKAESSAALDYTLGSLLLQQGDSAGAISNYRAAIRKFPNFMRAYKNLGLAYVQAGSYAEALPVLVKAIELGDGDGNSFGMLGFTYLSLNQPRSALDAYRMAYILRPENRDWKVGLAQALTLSGDHVHAAAILAELIEQSPTQTNYWLSRANSLIAMNEDQQAAAHLEIIKRMGKASMPTLRLLGDIYLNNRLPALAAKNYTEALMTGEGMTPAQVLASARNLVIFAAVEEASDFVTAAREKLENRFSKEEEIAFLNLSAEISLALHDDEEAARVLGEVILADPSNGRALLLLGNFHNRAGNYEEAAFYFERAATVASVKTDALIQHARMLVAQRNYGAAVPLLEQAQSINPSSNVENYLNAVRSAHNLSR